MTDTATEALFARTIPGTDYCAIFHECGEVATRIYLPGSGTVYPRGSDLSCLYEHPKGIVITNDEAEWLGIEFED